MSSADDGLADLERRFTISSTAAFIDSHRARRVALQFPDDCLAHAVAVAEALERRCGCRCFVLADTSYGSCCVDEVAAQHVDADVLVHFGESCASPTSRMPVKHVFGDLAIDMTHFSNTLVDFISTQPPTTSIIVLYHLSYSWAVPELCAAVERARPAHSSVVFAHLSAELIAASNPVAGKALCAAASAIDANASSSSCACAVRAEIVALAKLAPDAASALAPDATQSAKVASVNGISFALPSDTAPADSGIRDHVQHALTSGDRTHVLVFIGDEGPALTTVLLNFPYLSTYSYSPTRHASSLSLLPTTTADSAAAPSSSAWRLESALVNKALARRYYLVQKAKDCDIIGLVAGTLAVRDFGAALAHCARLIRAAGKRCYTVAVGKPNVAKLGNLPEIDLYVLIACPFASLLDSAAFGYTRDVITPFELELALAPGREWTGAYTTDFRQVLPTLADARFATPATDHNTDAAADADDDDDDEVRFSVVTGKLMKKSAPSRRKTVSISGGSGEANDERQLATVNAERTLAELGGDRGTVVARHLQRSWRGLEVALGQTPTAQMERGLSGIARGYQTEIDPSLRSSSVPAADGATAVAAAASVDESSERPSSEALHDKTAVAAAYQSVAAAEPLSAEDEAALEAAAAAAADSLNEWYS